MAKVSYVGVSSKARKVKKLYVGIGGKARKVKKAYIGVGGKARIFFSANSPGVGRALVFTGHNVYGYGKWSLVDINTLTRIGDWPANFDTYSYNYHNTYGTTLVGTFNWFCNNTGAYDPISGAKAKDLISASRFHNLDSLYQYDIVSYNYTSKLKKNKLNNVRKLDEDTFSVISSLSWEILPRSESGVVAPMDASGLRAGTMCVRFWGSGWGSDRDGYQKIHAEYSVNTGAHIRDIYNWSGEGANTGTDYQYDAFGSYLYCAGDGGISQYDAATLSRIKSNSEGMLTGSYSLNTFKGHCGTIKAL